MNFEGPDYTHEGTNEFKDLYLVKHYPNRARASIEVYALGDLGRVPKDSIWGKIEELRSLYEIYKVAMSRHRFYKNIGCYNNCNWFVTKADNIRQALNLYWEELEKETEKYKENPNAEHEYLKYRGISQPQRKEIE